MVGNQEVERRVEEGECRAFAGTVKSALHVLAGPKLRTRPATTLDIGRRERPEGPGHFRHSEIGEMPRFQCGDPLVEHVESVERLDLFEMGA